MRSLRYKLLLSFLLVILLPMGLAVLWTSNTLSTLLEKRFAEKAAAQAEHVRLLLNDKQEMATGLVNWIAAMQGVQAAVKDRDRDRLFQHLLPLVGSIQLDFIEILDKEGRIFLRVHDPSRYGDRPTLAKETQGLLQGMRDLPNYGVEERDGNLYLGASESIEENGILGVVSAGYALSPDFVKELEKVAGTKTVIAVGSRRLSREGAQRPAKSEATDGMAGQSMEPRWHREGPTPSFEVRVPLDTARGTEGRLSLFFPTQEMTAAIGALQKALLAVGLLGIALALLVSWALSRRLTNPIKELVRGTDQVAAGDYSAAVYMDAKDEIGALAVSFNRMLEELRRSRAEVERYRQELERKFAERSEELEETEKKRAAMAHMVAHDLKNPLLGIKKALESLAHNGLEEGEAKKKLLQDLLSASDLVVGMANEMLDLYRSDFGDLPLSLSAFSAEELIETTRRVLGPELEEKKLEMVQRIDPRRISLVADKRRMTRLLINLLSNAIKFSPKGGRIYVSAAETDAGKAGKQILLRVADEGKGIPEEDLPRIFDRFYSRDQGALETGTGLGLPYCKLVADAHKGKIWGERRSGGGFAISVLLPENRVEERRAYGT